MKTALLSRYSFTTFESPKSVDLKKLFTTVAIAFLYVTAVAQQQRQYLFSYLGIKDGLQEEAVYAVQQDAKGFIWISSANILQRYDGQRFLSFFHSENPKSIPAGYI